MSNTLDSLSKTIKIRKDAGPEASYTSSLLRSGLEKCSEKFGEECVELIIAAVSQDLDKFNNEAADVLYHLLVLIEAKDASLTDILSVLAQRQTRSGHLEKALRIKKTD